MMIKKRCKVITVNGLATESRVLTFAWYFWSLFLSPLSFGLHVNFGSDGLIAFLYGAWNLLGILIFFFQIFSHIQILYLMSYFFSLSFQVCTY